MTRRNGHPQRHPEDYTYEDDGRYAWVGAVGMLASVALVVGGLVYVLAVWQPW